MTKSLKPSFMKNVKSKESTVDFSNDNKKQVFKDVKDSLFVDCGKTIYDPEDYEPSFSFSTAEKLVFVFNANLKEADGNKSVSRCAVNIIKTSETYAELDVFEYTNATYMGKIKLRYGKEAQVIPAVNSTASNNFVKFVFSAISQIFRVLCEVMLYKCKTIEDIELPYSINKLPQIERQTYMDWYLTDELRDLESTYDFNYTVYNGPYKSMFSEYHGFYDLDDAKLINYNYQASDTPFELVMTEEIPFKNFILNLNDEFGDQIKMFLHYNGGKLFIGDRDYVAKTANAIACLDLNKWHIGSHLFITNKNLINVDFNYGKDKEKMDSVVVRINKMINAFTEFMLKFSRLMPYSENVNNASLEIHTANVVNNTSVYKIVILGGDKKKRSTSGHKGGTHASPREHLRIGHKRTCKSGKITYVKETTINEGHIGKVHKEYDTNNLI